MRKFLLLVFIISLSLKGYTQWQKIESPKGIKVNELFKTNNELFAGTANGIYKLELNEWKKLSEDVNYNVNSILTFNNYYFAGTSSNGIYRSNDAGDSWLQVNNNLTSTNVQVLRIYKNNIMVGTTNGLFASNNNGIQWENISNNIGNNNIKAILTFNDSLIVGTSNGVFISSDTAKTWRSINTGLTYGNITDIISVDTMIYACTSNGGVFSTINMGLSWDEINIGLTNRNTNCLYSYNDSLFVGTTDTLYYTADLTNIEWEPMSTEQFSDEVIVINEYNGFLYIGNSFGVYKRQNQFAGFNTGFPNWEITNLAVFDTTMLLSTNVGVWEYADNWDFVSNFPNNSINKLESMNDSVQLLFNNGGLYLSTDTLKNWTKISSKTNISSLLLKDTIIYIGTNGDGIFRSNDLGTSWLPINIGIGNKYIKQIVILYDYIFALSDKIYRTSDFGDQWQDIGETGNSAIAVKGASLYKASSSGIFCSSDYGNSWQSILVPTYGYNNIIGNTESFIVIDTLMFNFCSGNINISDINDTVWHRINKGYHTNNYTINGINLLNDNLLIWNNSNSIWKRKISTISHPKPPSNVRFYNQFYVDDPGGMSSYGIKGMITIDWDNNSDVSTIGIRRYWNYADIFVDANNPLITFNIDTLSESPDHFEVPFYLFYDDNGDWSQFSEASVLDNNLNSINNLIVKRFNTYPNPVENFLHVDIIENSRKNYTLRLHNSTGECIFKSQFNANYSIDFSAFNSGIYFLMISDNNNIIMSKKIVKQ